VGENLFEDFSWIDKNHVKIADNIFLKVMMSFYFLTKHIFKKENKK